jgi:hypothetical protein
MPRTPHFSLYRSGSATLSLRTSPCAHRGARHQARHRMPHAARATRLFSEWRPGRSRGSLRNEPRKPPGTQGRSPLPRRRAPGAAPHPRLRGPTGPRSLRPTNQLQCRSNSPSPSFADRASGGSPPGSRQRVTVYITPTRFARFTRFIVRGLGAYVHEGDGDVRVHTHCLNLRLPRGRVRGACCGVDEGLCIWVAA